LDEDYRQRINMDFANARERMAQSIQRLRAESMKAISFTERFAELDTVGLTLDVRLSEGGRIEVLSATQITNLLRVVMRRAAPRAGLPPLRLSHRHALAPCARRRMGT
jgi:hypothetical protein